MSAVIAMAGVVLDDGGMGWPCPACSTAIPDDAEPLLRRGVGPRPPWIRKSQEWHVCSGCRSLLCWIRTDGAGDGGVHRHPPEVVATGAVVERMHEVAAAGGEIPPELEALEALETIARLRGDLSGGRFDVEKLAQVLDGFLRADFAPAHLESVLGPAGPMTQSQALNGRVVGFHTKAGSGIRAARVIRRGGPGLFNTLELRLHPSVILQVPAPLLFRNRSGSGYHIAGPRPTQLVTRGEPQVAEVELHTPG